MYLVLLRLTCQQLDVRRTCDAGTAVVADVPLGASTGKRAILSTSAAEEAVKALGEEDGLLLLNALKLVASIAAHPGENRCVHACCM